MTYPIFHPDEEARLSAYTFDWRIANQHCKVLSVLKPIGGDHRYAVKTLGDGVCSIVLESSLLKKWERSDWGMLRGIWQPKREAR